MKTRYSKTTGAFYPFDIDYPNLPADVIEMPIEAYHAAMARPAGHSFDFIDGELVITAPVPPSLAELKVSALTSLNQQAQAIADQLTAGYPEFEKLTWEDQRREALAWDADNTAPTPYIDGLAAVRGIDRIDYLHRTVAKTKAFATAAQKLVGQRQMYEDRIKAVNSVEGLEAIQPVFNLE